MVEMHGPKWQVRHDCADGITARELIESIDVTESLDKNQEYRFVHSENVRARSK